MKDKRKRSRKKESHPFYFSWEICWRKINKSRNNIRKNSISQKNNVPYKPDSQKSLETNFKTISLHFQWGLCSILNFWNFVCFTSFENSFYYDLPIPKHPLQRKVLQCSKDLGLIYYWKTKFEFKVHKEIL